MLSLIVLFRFPWPFQSTARSKAHENIAASFRAVFVECLNRASAAVLFTDLGSSDSTSDANVQAGGLNAASVFTHPPRGEDRKIHEFNGVISGRSGQSPTLSLSAGKAETGQRIGV